MNTIKYHQQNAYHAVDVQLAAVHQSAGTLCQLVEAGQVCSICHGAGTIMRSLHKIHNTCLHQSPVGCT